MWRNWIREDPLVHPYRWLRLDLVPPAPFHQCAPHLTPDRSGVLSDPGKIDEEFRKAWLPYFCCSGQRDTSLEEFSFEVEGWLPLLPEILALDLILWWVALVLLPLSLVVRFGLFVGLCLTLRFVCVLIILGGSRGFLCLFGVRLCGLPLGYLFLIKVEGLRLSRFRGFGIYMMIGSSLCRGMML